MFSPSRTLHPHNRYRSTKDLQHVINVIADDFYLDANNPVEIVNWLAESLVELQEAIKPVLDLDNYNDDSNGQYWFKRAMLDI